MALEPTSEVVNIRTGEKDVDEVERIVRGLIRDLETGDYLHDMKAISPRTEIDALKAVTQESERVIKTFRDARGSKLSKKKSLGGIWRTGRKADRRIADLSLALTAALTERYTIVLQNQLSAINQQKRRLGHQQNTIREMNAASLGQQSSHKSIRTSLALLNDGDNETDRLKSRAAAIKHGALSWLKAPESSEARHKGYSTMRQRNPDTCTWLDETPEYQHWQKSSRPSCLWVYGKPGTGKSIFMSKILDDLSASGDRFAYFYMGHCKTQTAWDVAAGLLQQLCKMSTIMPRALEVFEDSHGLDRQPQLANLLMAMEEFGDLHSMDVTILLDAWDKSNMHHSGEFDKLFSQLTSLPWKVLITSRTTYSSDLVLKNFFQIDMCDRSSSDLESFVLKRLRTDISVSELSFLGREDDFLGVVARSIVQKSDNTFFLAEIQTQRILEQINIRDIRITLDELPWDPRDIIHQAFDLVISQPENLRNLACKSLVWVANIERPLSVEGLREGFATLPSVKTFTRREILRQSQTFFSYALVALARTRLRLILSRSTSRPKCSSHGQISHRDPLDETRIQQEANVAARQVTEDNYLATEKRLSHESPQAFEDTLGRPTAVFEIDPEAKPPHKAFLGQGGCCKGLLTREPGSSNVILAYDGIRGYLKTYRRNGFTEKVYEKELESLALACLYYLLQTQFVSGPSKTHVAYLRRIKSNPFLEYAAICWPGHARKAANPAVVSLLLLLFESRNNLASAVQVYLLQNLLSASEEEFKTAYEISTSMSPLQIATRLNLLKVVKILVKENDPLEADILGNTALHEAMNQGNAEAFKLLFDKAVETIFYEKNSRLTPGHFFADAKDRDALIDFYKTNVLASRVLLEAIKADDFHAVLACLCSGESVNDSSLEAAISSQSTNLIFALLRFGAEAKDSISKAILQAVRTNRTDVLNILLAYSQSVPLNDALFQAIQTGNLEVVKLLLKNGADINAKEPITGCGVLHKAAARGLPELVKCLLSNGADTSQLDGLERNPLFDTMHNIEIMKLLLDSGADVNAKGPNTGRGLLHEAVTVGQPKLVKCLLSYGADPSQLDSSDRTPLFDAIKAKDIASIKQLLQYGVDIDATESLNGRSALHEAAILGNEEILTLIINRSIQINRWDKANKTPGDYAKDDKTIRLLLARMQDTSSRSYSKSVQDRVLLDAEFPDKQLTRRLTRTW